MKSFIALTLAAFVATSFAAEPAKPAAPAKAASAPAKAASAPAKSAPK